MKASTGDEGAQFAGIISGPGLQFGRAAGFVCPGLGCQDIGFREGIAGACCQRQKGFERERLLQGLAQLLMLTGVGHKRIEIAQGHGLVLQASTLPSFLACRWTRAWGCMVQPRWLRPLQWRDAFAAPMRARRWDQFVALWASLNLLLVVFDITYVPLRNFWLQRRLYPLPGVPLVIPLTALPDITPWVDPLKGIEAHRDTLQYQRHWEQLDAQLLRQPPQAPRSRALLQQQVVLTQRMIDENPFLLSDQSGTLERIKNLLRRHAGPEQDSARDAAAVVLSPAWLQHHPWAQERQFWERKVLPLVATNYWRSIDENGRPTNRFWRVDLLWFQSVFALDILLKLLAMKRRRSGMSWRDVLLRRWYDLPLLLPFWRLSRVVPVVVRLRSSGLVDAEPVRAVVSRGVVTLLAVELIEVLALQLLDGVQGLVRSPRLAERLRGLSRPPQLEAADASNGPRLGEAEQLIRLWLPLVLGRVLPRLEPELQDLLAHPLQRSLEATAFPVALQQLKPLLLMERELSRQLAGGMVDGVLDLSRGTANEMNQSDRQGRDLLQRTVEAFWRELAEVMNEGEALGRSQELVCALIEQLKRTYLTGVNQAGVEGLMDELDRISDDRSAAEP